MDFGSLGDNAPIFLLIIGIILLQIFLRRGRKPKVVSREVVQSLLSEVRLNQALVETFDLRQKPKKLEAVSWQRHKDKLDFLKQSLRGALSDSFMIIEDFNRQIDAAKKHGSSSYMVNVDVTKLKEPLDRSRQGLEEWFLASADGKDSLKKSTGVLDDWLGRG